MQDIEDVPNTYCKLFEKDCQYKIGTSCMHPIHTYLDSKKVNVSKDKVETNKYDFPIVYSKQKINEIFNYMDKYKFFDDKNIYLSVYYFELMLQFSNIKVTKNNIYPIYFLSLMVAHKYLMDTPYTNQTFAVMYEVDLSYLNMCEIYFLADIRFNLNYKLKNDIKTVKIGEAIKEFQSKTICNAVISFDGYIRFIKKYHTF